MSDYKDYQVQTSPPFMLGPMGVNWNTVFGLMKDAYLEAMKRAVKARYPDTAPSDALDSIGWTRQIERAYAKNDDVYVAQLDNAWKLWSVAGTRQSVIQALNYAGYPNVEVWEVGSNQYINFLLNLPAHVDKTGIEWIEPPSTTWNRFWVVLRPPYPWQADPPPQATWDGSGLTWDLSGIKWGEDIPSNDQLRAFAIVNKWKPAHTRCAAIILAKNGARLWGDIGGTWASHSTQTYASQEGSAITLVHP